MEAKELLRVLHTAERLKDETRHCYTSGGRRESVAEHSWRLALTVAVLLGVGLALQLLACQVTGDSASDYYFRRQALGLAFRGGVPVGEDVIPIDEGLSFTVTDGVLEAALELRLDLVPEEPAGERMEALSQRYTRG